MEELRVVDSMEPEDIIDIFRQDIKFKNILKMVGFS